MNRHRTKCVSSVASYPMEVKHIYWFAYFNPDAPSVRYRAMYPLEHLEEYAQITYSFVYPAYTVRNIARFIHVYFSALLFRKKNSIIVIQKLSTNGLYANALKLLVRVRKEHTHYDIDDAEHTRRPVGTLHYFMRHCSSCSAGSQELVNYIRQFNSNTFLLTSPVIRHQQKKQSTARDVLTIGWIGFYGAHRQNLTELLFPALQQLEFPVECIFLGLRSPAEAEELQEVFHDHPHVRITAPLAVDWHNEEAVYTMISRFDVGVSPLLDTEFNRSKSAFKLKQYLSCGVPALASRVGENSHFLINAYNGWLCSNSDDFLMGLRIFNLLYRDEYALLSEHAHASREAFTIDAYCQGLLDIFRKTGPRLQHPHAAF